MSGLVGPRSLSQPQDGEPCSVGLITGACVPEEIRPIWRGLQEVWMNTIGVVLLAAATATSGIGKPHVWKNWMRPHAVQHGPAPAGGPITAAMMGPGAGADASGFGRAGNRRFPNVRSQIFFVDPPGMHIGWQAGGGPNGDRIYLPAQLTVPARYNFNQGYIYRLKLSEIPGRPGLNLYPTIEVAPSTPATDAFLTHNPIPAQFTEEDFDQVTAGNFVTKVIYLPDPKYQELAIAGVETLVSTRLEPGVDPILEADRRGTILMIVRLGAIDLEMPSAAPGTYVGAPAGGVMAPGSVISPTIVPGSIPNTYDPGTMVPGTVGEPFGAAPVTEPLDTAPVAEPVDSVTPPPVPPATTEELPVPDSSIPNAPLPDVPDSVPAPPAAPTLDPPSIP